MSKRKCLNILVFIEIATLIMDFIFSPRYWGKLEHNCDCYRGIAFITCQAVSLTSFFLSSKDLFLGIRICGTFPVPGMDATIFDR